MLTDYEGKKKSLKLQILEHARIVLPNGAKVVFEGFLLQIITIIATFVILSKQKYGREDKV